MLFKKLYTSYTHCLSTFCGYPKNAQITNIEDKNFIVTKKLSTFAAKSYSQSYPQYEDNLLIKPKKIKAERGCTF